MYSSSSQYESLSVVLLTTLFWAPPTVLASEEVQHTSGDRVRESLEAMSRSSLERSAYEQLVHLPADDVIPAIVRALREEETFSPKFADPRLRLYMVLGRRYGEHASDFPPAVAELAYRQILAGLAEGNMHIKGTCATALAAAPEKFHQEVASVIGTLLREVLAAPEAPEGTTADDGKGYRGHFLAPAIRTLGSLAHFGHPYLEDIERIFRDPNAGEFVRSTALDAIVRLGGIKGGIEGSLDHFDQLDPIGRKLLLGRFGYKAAKTGGQFDNKAEHQEAIRNFIIDSLESPDADVRRAAAEALSPAFGADTVIFESPTVYELNPLLEETLEHLARNSPDALLQDRASKTLTYLREHLDDVAQKILRERQKEKKTGETVPLP